MWIAGLGRYSASKQALTLMSDTLWRHSGLSYVFFETDFLFLQTVKHIFEDYMGSIFLMTSHSCSFYHFPDISVPL